MGEALTLQQVHKAFGRTRALDGLDLSVTTGEIHGLLGPNGAGKTTAIRILLGLLRADAGTTQLLGGDPWRDGPSLHRRIAYVPGDVILWPTLSGGEVIDLLGRLRGGLDPRHRADLLERFDLDPAKKGRAYSKGNRQKVALVAALASDAELLILDEPTAGLDPQSRIALWEAVEELHHDGTTVVLTTHYMEEADQLCDRLAIVDHGKVLVLDTPDSLKKSAGGDTIVALLLDGDPAVAIGALTDLEGVTRAEVVHGQVRLFVHQLEGLLPRIVERCQPWGLRDVAIEEPSLETVFISLTGRALRD